MGNKVLYVDDDKALLCIVSRYLEDMEYTPVTVSNSKKALEIAKKEHPLLILLDILMPDLNGIDLCKMMREDSDLSDTPIIFLSAADETAKIEAVLAGGMDFIRKPFSLSELGLRIKIVLREHAVNKKVENLIRQRDEIAMQIHKHTVETQRLRNVAGKIISHEDISLSTNIEDSRFDSLTKKEKAILELLVSGNTSIQIGNILNISSRTVEVHIRNTRKKLDIPKSMRLNNWLKDLNNTVV